MNKDKIVNFPDMKGIEAEAAQWIMRFEDGISAEDRTAFYAWQSQSDQHRDAFQRLTRLWDAMDAVEELNDYAEAGAVKSKQSSSYSRRGFLAAAAASVALVLTTGALYQTAKGYLGHHEGVYETRIGEQKTVSLPDGSFIKLNTNSHVDVTYTGDARLIKLTRGEAYFDVARDTDRPFSVNAGRGVVTAVGTAFTVWLKERVVDVTVAEGRVALSAYQEPKGAGDTLEQKTEAKAKPLLEVTAGQTAVFDDKIETLDHIEEPALERKLAWRDGLLSFAGEPLLDVVADISRYTDIQIDIENETLKSMPIAGYFRVGQVDAMFEALELMAGIKVEHVNAKQVRLVPASRG